MPNAETMTAILMPLLAMILSINVVFVALVFSRRIWRSRYFKGYDWARNRYFGAVCGFANDRLSLAKAAAVLGEAKSPAARDAVQKMLLEAIDDENRYRISDLLFRLDYVGPWAAAAFGESRARYLMECFRKGTPAKPLQARSQWKAALVGLRFFSVRRAVAVFKLGQLDSEPGFYFARQALRDPSAVVRRLAVTAIGNSRHPLGVGLLVTEMARSVRTTSDLSLQHIQAALLQYQIGDLEHFQPYLSHPHPQVRFFLVDAIRQICDRGALRTPLQASNFPARLCAQFLKVMAEDGCADVRARTAGVIRHFRNADAIETLRVLTYDPSEFVRLWATRVCSDDFGAALVPDLLRCLSDPSWRVRQEAAKSLVELGPVGKREMYSHYVRCDDTVMREQVAEIIQRAGLTKELVAMLFASRDEVALAESVCCQMTLQGLTSSFDAALLQSLPEKPRLLLNALLAVVPQPGLNMKPQTEMVPVSLTANSAPLQDLNSLSREETELCMAS